jgi:HPt (histidine-containing phosphotransfer) domain-containing protein
VAKPVDRETLICAIHRYARPRASLPTAAEVTDGVAPEVAELIPNYLASKPRQIEEAEACLAAKDFEPIRRFGHNLRGTGPGYGFPFIAELGKEIEKAAAAGDEHRIATQLDALHRMVLSHTAAPLATASVTKCRNTARIRKDEAATVSRPPRSSACN